MNLAPSDNPAVAHHTHLLDYSRTIFMTTTIHPGHEAYLASGDSSVMKRGSMKLWLCSSVPAACHRRNVEFL